MARVNAMPPQPAHNVFRVVFGGIIEVQATATTFWYADDKAIGTATRASFTDLLAALGGVPNFTNLYSSCCSADWHFTNITIDSPTSPTLAPYVFPTVTPGSGPGVHMPTQVAVTITKETAFKSQHARSRISMPAVPDNWVIDSTVQTKAAYTALASAMTGPLTGTATVYTPGIYSVEKIVTGPPLTGWAPLLACIVRDTVGTCRRRKLGVGI